VKDAGLEITFTIGEESHPVGLLAISRPPGGEIEADEVASLNALLGIAASGISNARAHLETKRVNENLDQKVQELRALLDLVRGLAAALEPEAVASLLMLTLAGRWAVRRYTLAAWKDGHPAVVRAKGMKFDRVLDYKDSFNELPEAVRVADLVEGELKDLLTQQDAAIIFPLRALSVSSASSSSARARADSASPIQTSNSARDSSRKRRSHSRIRGSYARRSKAKRSNRNSNSPPAYKRNSFPMSCRDSQATTSPRTTARRVNAAAIITMRCRPSCARAQAKARISSASRMCREKGCPRRS
jgi:hypothetical protein